MKLSIIPVFFAFIFVVPPAISTDYTDIGTYSYDCNCYQAPPGGAGSTGVCYPPGTKHTAPSNPHYVFPDFTIDSSSPKFPNDYTTNGYQFELKGYDEIWIYAHCESGKIHKVKFDKSSEIGCKKEESTKHHKKYRCRNDHSGTHHLNLEYYQCGCTTN